MVGAGTAAPTGRDRPTLNVESLRDLLVQPPTGLLLLGPLANGGLRRMTQDPGQRYLRDADWLSSAPQFAAYLLREGEEPGAREA
jgi:hypothetical protein